MPWLLIFASGLEIDADVTVSDPVRQLVAKFRWFPPRGQDCHRFSLPRGAIPTPERGGFRHQLNPTEFLSRHSSMMDHRETRPSRADELEMTAHEGREFVRHHVLCAEGATESLRGLSIAGFDRMCVDRQRHGRVGMAKSSGNSPWVHPLSNHLCRAQMTKIVEAELP